MMLILSASQPTVSATTGLRTPRARGSTALRITLRSHHLEHLGVDAFYEIVATLIEFVYATLGGGHLMVVIHTRLVLFVP
jgi:hypothetical protein